MEPMERNLNEMGVMEKFQIFIDKNLRQYRKHIGLMGYEMSGRMLTQDEMIASVKLFKKSIEKGGEF